MQVYPARNSNSRNHKCVLGAYFGTSAPACNRHECFVKASSTLRGIAFLLFVFFVTMNAPGANAPSNKSILFLYSKNIGKPFHQAQDEVIVGRLSNYKLGSFVESPTYAFDARALKRLGISESRLPPVSELLFQPSLWESYRRYLLSALLFLVVETALIAVLLLEKRRGKRSQVLLARRFAIEQVISEYSTRLAECPPAQVEAECKNVLKAVVDAEEIDGAAWAQISESTKAFLIICSAERGDLKADPMFRGRLDLPWATQALLRGQAVSIDCVEDIPLEGYGDRQCFRSIGIESAALIPASIGGGSTGVLMLACQANKRPWPLVLIARLSVLGNICAGAFERKLATESKRESEQRFRCLFEEAPIGIGLEDLDGRLWFANPSLCKMLGYTAEEIRGMNSAQFLDVDDKEEARRLFHELRAGLTGSYQREMRFRRRDGTLMWGRFNSSLLKGFSADLPLVVVMVIDITERKAAEEKLRCAQRELQQLTARLIQAQEDERQRIARELHDDIGQRLSLLKIGLDIFAQEMPVTMDKGHAQLAELLTEADELATDVHGLSHQLHSGKLRTLGLRAALRELCSQVARQHHLEVELTTDESVSHVPEDVALCLYRVAQEALSNAVKHSDTSKISVSVTEPVGSTRMEIKDFGIGFDPAAQTGGLGMASMRERLRIVGGQLFIQSIPGGGTELIAVVAEQPIGKQRKAS
jgi:PAS domain S-box-containing protein